MLATLLQASAPPEPAQAQPAAKPKQKAASNTGLSLEQLAVMLSSHDADELRLAIESAPGLRKGAVAPLLVERVRAGLSPELLSAAMDALVSMGDRASFDLFTELAAHRRAQVRARALLAHTMLRPPNAEAALIKGLSDADGEVRAAALSGLSEIGTRQCLAALFQALDRDVEGAAEVIGKLAEPSTVPRVTAYFGRTSFLNLAPILDGLLLRRTLPEPVKLSLIEAIVKHGTAEARAYLEGLGPRLPSDSPARVRKSITDALTRMPK